MFRFLLALAGVMALAGPAWSQSGQRHETLMMPPYAVLGVPTGAIAADFAVAVQPAFEARSGISAAFLCWVRYGDDPTPALALLIVGAPDQSLREAIGAVFTRMSGPNDTMDMIFLEPAQAADLQIPAIYTRSGERP